VTPFFEIDLDRDDAARVWEGRSFLLLEPEELDLGLSPSAGEDASGLFERRLRLSVGMFWRGQLWTSFWRSLPCRPRGSDEK